MSESRPDRKKIAAAAKAIRKGGVVVFPTETVYGIGADAFNRDACARIFKIKGRPSDNPLIIHVDSMKMARTIGKISERHARILRRLWPAPLTVLVEARIELPLRKNKKEVSLRMPRNRIALELIRQSGTPIAAPSANLSKRPSATSGSHAIGYFRGKADVIIDSGRSEHGLESTILDLKSFTLLRPGAVSVGRLEKAFGRKIKVGDVARGTTESREARAPGMKYRHYSPVTRLFMYEGDINDLSRIIGSANERCVFIGSDSSCDKIHGAQKIRLGRNAKQIAHNLFDALIRLDRMHADFGIVESFDEQGLGLAIMNRLRKATSHKTFSSRAGLARLLGNS